MENKGEIFLWSYYNIFGSVFICDYFFPNLIGKTNVKKIYLGFVIYSMGYLNYMIVYTYIREKLKGSNNSINYTTQVFYNTDSDSDIESDVDNNNNHNNDSETECLDEVNIRNHQ